MSYRTKKREPVFTDYEVRRWSTAVRVRDNFTCCVCLEKIVPRYKSQAHHIFPQREYPEEACSLYNGVTVCAKHHQRVIHTTRTSWGRWVQFCRKWLWTWAKLQFNLENQHKIRRGR